MGFSAIEDYLPLIVAAVILIMLEVFFRKRRAGTRKLEVAQDVLMELKLNKVIAENINRQPKPRKFNTTMWRLRRKKLDFLDESLMGKLADAYTLVEDYNHQVNTAKKLKSSAYLASVDVDKLTGLLTRGEQSLEEWLAAEGVSGPKPPPEVPGMFDGFFGWKR